MFEDEVNESRTLLRRLARSEAGSLRAVLLPAPFIGGDVARAGPALDRRTRLLVNLAALLVADASTESLRWAVELASTCGADDDALAAVFVATGAAAGSAQLVASAPRLALALGVEPPDGTVDY